MSYRSLGGEPFFITRPNRPNALTVLTLAHLSLDDRNATFATQPPRQETGLICPSHPNQLIKGNGASVARRICGEGATNNQRLPGAGAEQRMAGGAVKPKMRQQPLVPSNQIQPHRATGALAKRMFQERKRPISITPEPIRR